MKKGGAEGGTRTRTRLPSLDPESNFKPFLLLDVFLLSFISIAFSFLPSAPFSSMLFSECPKFVPKFPSESGYFHGRLCSPNFEAEQRPSGKIRLQDSHLLALHNNKSEPESDNRPYLFLDVFLLSFIRKAP